MHQVAEKPEAKELGVTTKIGYKEGIIRIWQKMSEYEQVVPLKIIHHKV